MLHDTITAKGSRQNLIFVRCVFCVRCIGQSASPSPGPDVTAAPDPSAKSGVWANIPLPPSTITPLLLFDCYRIVFYIICIPGKYSISIGEHYCKIHIRIEGGDFLVFFTVSSCNILYLGQYLQFTERHNIWWAEAQNGIIMGHFTVCQTYYYDEIENIILLLTHRLLVQVHTTTRHLSNGCK